MLEYDKIDLSEGIDANKTNGLHECIICHYWYFSQKYIIMQKAVSFNDVAIFFW